MATGSAGRGPRRSHGEWATDLFALGASLGAPRGGAREISFVGDDPMLPSPVRVAKACGLALGLGASAAATIHQQRTGDAQDITVRADQAVTHLVTFVALQRSRTVDPPPTDEGRWLERWQHLRLPSINGVPVSRPGHDVFTNALIRPYRTRDDRVIYFTCPYPWMRDRVAALLDVNPHDPVRVSSAVARWNATELEQCVADVGGAAAVVRTSDEWDMLPQAAAVESTQLVQIERFDDSPAEPLPAGSRPLEGVRALGEARVIAAPVLGSTLAQHGADVLNLRNPGREDTSLAHATGLGMRHAFLDHRSPDGARAFARLVADADVWFDNARPGSAHRRGTSPEALAKLRPGIVHVSLSCFGHVGPWALRPGFVQQAMAATGAVALGERDPMSLPPVGPLNDYLAGWLGAAGAMIALARRATEGGSYRVRVNLARVGTWYLSLGLLGAEECALEALPDGCASEMFETETALGTLLAPVPAASMSTTPPRFDPVVLVPPGASRLEWLAHPQHMR